MKPNNLGLSLLEVLIALIILAVAFTSSFLTLSATTRRLLTLKEKTAGQWVGLNVIAKKQLQVLSGSGNQQSGSELMFNNKWNWILNVTSTPDRNVSQINVTVRKENSLSSTQLIGYLINDR